MKKNFPNLWAIFWMHLAGIDSLNRLSCFFASWFVPPYKKRSRLSAYNTYISHKADISHKDLNLGKNVFIGDGVVIFQADSGTVELGDKVYLYKDVIIETGEEGDVVIGEGTHIQPRCSLSAYKGSITIGSGVGIAPNCALYPYNHGVKPGATIRNQPLVTRGGIVIGDDAWLGVGVIVLDGVKIGKGAVVGAGSIVTEDIPDGAIAVGAPAKVVRMRGG